MVGGDHNRRVTRWIFHLAFEADWEAAQVTGEYRVSTRGRTLEEEGFIHLASASQLAGVARRFYANVAEPLVVLSVDLLELADEVRLEVPPGASEAFPHLYGPLPVAAVADVRPFDPASPDTRLHHAHIFANDIADTIDWWTRHLGAEVLADEFLLGSRNVMIAVGDGRLNVYDQPPRSVAADSGRGSIHHLGIQVRDLEGLVASMSAAGVEFRKGITHGEGFKYLMVAAPDDILLELFEAVDASMPPAAAGWFSWS